MATAFPPVLAIGLMSGTSQDGVDVAAIETDGDIITRFGPTARRRAGVAVSVLATPARPSFCLVIARSEATSNPGGGAESCCAR